MNLCSTCAAVSFSLPPPLSPPLPRETFRKPSVDSCPKVPVSLGGGFIFFWGGFWVVWGFFFFFFCCFFWFLGFFFFFFFFCVFFLFWGLSFFFGFVLCVVLFFFFFGWGCWGHSMELPLLRQTYRRPPTLFLNVGKAIPYSSMLGGILSDYRHCHPRHFSIARHPSVLIHPHVHPPRHTTPTCAATKRSSEFPGRDLRKG